MSPEQVQGKSVDHRSDIFSLGCVLYEAATRQRPFQADSDIETLHKILKERPQPIEEINPEAPGELRRIVRRCLAKSPDQRAQGMKDLALELADLADEFDTLSASSGSGTRVSSGVMGEAPANRRMRGLTMAGFAAGVLGLAAIAWSLWRLPAGTPADETSPASISITRVLSSPDLRSAGLSPDGRQLVYLRQEPGGTGLWLHQLATGSDARLQPPAPGNMRVSFSADGSYVITQTERDGLYRLPAIGGTRERLSFARPAQPSPDGRRVAAVQVAPGAERPSFVVADLDGSNERVLVSPDQAEVWEFDWSADGTSIAAAIRPRGPDTDSAVQLVVVDASTGNITPVGSARWGNFESLAWLGDGSGLIVAGQPRDEAATAERRFQLWLVAYPDGRLSRLTNDTADYSDVTTSSDGRLVAAMQTRQGSRVWRAPNGNLAEATEIGGIVTADARYAAPSATDTAVFMTRTGRDSASIWTIESDGRNAHRLTPESMLAYGPLVAPRADLAIFRIRDRTRDEAAAYFAGRMTLDGRDARRLTTETDVEYPRAVSPDGAFVLLFRRAGGVSWDSRRVWRQPTSGGAPTLFLEEDGQIQSLQYSTDGTRLLVAVVDSDESATGQVTMKVMPADGSRVLRAWDAPEGTVGQNTRWAPSGDAIDFVREVDGAENIWRQPVGGGPAQQLTTLTGSGLFQFSWSPDGKSLYYIRHETLASDVVLISNFRADGRTP